MPGYTIKKLESDQFDILIPLMKNCFGMDVTIDYFRWKYLGNPAGSFIGFVAIETDTGEIAASFNLIPEKYIIEGKETIIYQGCDAMTHSNHRRKGLFQKLVTYCHDYLKNINQLFLIALAGGTESTRGLMKLGWQRVFNFRFLFIPKILCYFSLLSNSTNEGETVSDLRVLEPLIEKKSFAKIYSFRNIDHLLWRYANPLHSYNVVAFSNNSAIEGYICYYIDNRKIFLFDFVFTTPKSQKSLLGNLKRRVVKEKLKGIVTFCQENNPLVNKLKRSGFLMNHFKRGPLSDTPPLLFYSDEKSMSKFSNPNCWSIISYDHDAS